jgi:hypothetical protein
MRTEEKKEKNYVITGEFLRQTKKKQMAAALGIAVILGMTGCAGKEGARENPQENVSSGAENDTERQENTDGGTENGQEVESGSDVPKTQEGEWAREEPVPAQGKENEEPPESGSEAAKEPAKEGQAVTLSQETEHLAGKVQKPQADGMTLAQTTLMDEDGVVTLLEVKDAKNIPVKFTQDTKVEHWTIQGGGAGIDMREAAVSDLEEGMGVELEGYYEGETFVATRVIMEVYV